MRGLNHLLLSNSVAALVFCLTFTEATAQTNQINSDQRPRGARQRQGNFDPAQFQQRMMDRYRERLEISDDSEWKAIQPLIQNVLDARMALGGGGRGGFGRSGRRDGDGNPTAAPVQRRAPTRENQAAEELQKAIDAKAPASEMKAALVKYHDYRKAKQGELDKAREALRAVLTSRQEAIASLSGLL
jgi:hypothetical protein